MVQIGEGPYIPHVFGEAVSELLSKHHGWLTAAVQHSIPWPEKDVLIQYDGEDYILRGLNQQGGRRDFACISIRFNHEISLLPTLNRIYRFTSILGWFFGGYVDVVGHVRGSRPMLHASGWRPYRPVMTSGSYGFNCNFMPLIKDEPTRKALAFWREGLRLESIHDSYSFLSFYKVIESQFADGKSRNVWITATIPALNGGALQRVRELEAIGLDVGEHIFQCGRCANARTSLDGPLIDPDIPEDRIRIAKDLVVVKALAEMYIRKELGVPDQFEVRQHRDALRPLYEYLEQSQVEDLKRGGSVLRKKIGLNGLLVSINHWPHQAPQALQDLALSVASAHNGIVDLRAANNGVSLGFLLDFPQRRARTNLGTSGVIPADLGGTPESEIAYLQYQKAVVGHGVIELSLPNRAKIVCEIMSPLNIDVGRAFPAINRKISTLREAHHD